MGDGDLLAQYINARGGLPRATSRPAPVRVGRPAPIRGGSGMQNILGPSNIGPSPRIAAQHHGGGGGFFHDIGQGLHDIKAGVSSGINWTGNKINLAGHDISAMPAGAAHGIETIMRDQAKFEKEHLGIPAWASSPAAAIQTAFGHPINTSGGYKSGDLAKVAAKQTWDSVRHPLRDPFQGILTAAAIASLGAGAVARAGAAADAASAASRLGEAGDAASLASRAGEGVKAFVKTPTMPNRIIKVPVTVGGKTKFEDAQFIASQRPLARAFQELHDKIVERALNTRIGKENPGPIEKYAAKRVGYTAQEIGRNAQRMRSISPQMLSRIKDFGNGLSKDEGNLALFLRSANVMSHEARDFWGKAVEHSEYPGEAQRLFEISHDLLDKGVLKVIRGKVEINAKDFPKLKEIDSLVKRSQSTREGIINRFNLMSPESMRERIDLVPTIMRSEVVRGADGVQHGQGYTDLALSKGQMARYPRSANNPVTGLARSFIRKTIHATGEGVEQGLIPKNTLKGVARSEQEALNLLTKNETRTMITKYGSSTRQAGDEVLVAKPGSKIGKIGSAVRETLGQQESTIAEAEHKAGLATGIQRFLHDMLPHTDETSDIGKQWQAAQKIGTTAPKGYVWVSKHLVGDLARSIAPRSGIGKFADNINSVVTGMTVYFKLSHVPQRFMTDATTGVLGGSLLSPTSLRFATQLYKDLGGEDSGVLSRIQRAAQATGVHGYSALPHEGEGIAGKFASSGANAYARVVDSPFRFVNLAHEAYKAGIRTPQEFEKMLKYAENPLKKGMSAADKQKYQQVLGRTNRVSMMYDGMTARERATIARGLWFYPWTKAAFRYAGHVAAEHPVVSAGLAATGKQGEAQQKKYLGALPDFAQGLIPLDGGKETSNAGILTPFNTVGTMMNTASGRESLMQNLNPAAAAALALGTGLNSFGQVKGSKVGNALSDLVSPTPEFSILNDYLHAKSAERKSRMFPHKPSEDFFTRLLLGPSFPRKTNRSALHKEYRKEHPIPGSYQITIP